jgi:hypothetical protein
METFDRPIFHYPFSAVWAGASKQGKSFALRKLIKNHVSMIKPEIEEIHYFYSVEQKEFEEIKDLVHFHACLPNAEYFRNSNKRTLIIADDLQDELLADNKFVDFFTRESHHSCSGLGLSIIFVVHDLFQGDKMKKIRRNTDLTFLFNSPNDVQGIMNLAQRWCPADPRYVIDAYNKAMRTRYNFLLLDNQNDTPIKLRCRERIWPNDLTIVNLSKKLHI